MSERRVRPGRAFGTRKVDASISAWAMKPAAMEGRYPTAQNAWMNAQVPKIASPRAKGRAKGRPIHSPPAATR